MRTYPVPVPIPVPSTSSCLSLASVVSEHQPEVQDSRQACQPTHTPMKARSPARSQPRRSRRRAGRWTPQKDEGKSSVCKTTAEGHLQVSKSARFVRICVRHICRNWWCLVVPCADSSASAASPLPFSWSGEVGGPQTPLQPGPGYSDAACHP